MIGNGNNPIYPQLSTKNSTFMHGLKSTILAIFQKSADWLDQCSLLFLLIKPIYQSSMNQKHPQQKWLVFWVLRMRYKHCEHTTLGSAKCQKKCLLGSSIPMEYCNLCHKRKSLTDSICLKMANTQLGTYVSFDKNFLHVLQAYAFPSKSDLS